MFRLFACILSICISLFPYSQSQECPGGVTPPGADPKWSTIPNRFELMAELITDNEIMEIGQAFSSTRDSIFLLSNNVPKAYYWDYTTEEYFDVLLNFDDPSRQPECKRTEITSDQKTSLIEGDRYILKPSILLGFTSRNELNPNWGNRLDSTGFVRDIPVNIFKSCFEIDDFNATAEVTYYASDVTKFQAYLPANESLLLQFDVHVSTQDGQSEKYQYNVFRFLPNPSRRQERQALETPSGVYCVNRTIGRSVPTNIPDRVITNAEIYLPEYNKSIVSAHKLHDLEHQFSRDDFWAVATRGQRTLRHYTSVHDYGVGLSYHYNNDNHQCEVTDIDVNSIETVSVDGNPHQYQMATSQHLFLLDDITYQFTGEKWCRDRVLCNVWIGENRYSNGSVDHREWYWATRINDEILTQWIPMKLIIKRYESNSLNFTSEMVFFNYRPGQTSTFEVEYTLADCYRALGPSQNFNLAVLSFTIANTKKYPFIANINTLRSEIRSSLLDTLQIRPIRLSNVIVDQDDQDIIVTFTLLDAAPRTGPVEVPLIETSLNELMTRLENVINSNALLFRLKYNDKTILLRARTNSLNLAHLTNQQLTRESGPLITGLWIGCVIAGLLIGGVVSFFIFEKLATKN